MIIFCDSASILPRSARSVAQYTLFIASLAVALWLSGASGSFAAPPRALPEGQVPKDARLEPLKDLDGYFPFTPAASKEEWDKRAERVRRQTLVSQGLWPMPTKTPANAVVYGLIDRGDYTVEKVFLESYPGHFVTGSLYRPRGRTGKLPGVLCPHGHWPNGRFYDSGPRNIRNDLVNGAERFENSGRYPLQARCVQLARMGCVVFHYDMVGYADSQQLSQSLVHGFAKQRPEMATAENWGFFSPQAELRLQNVMGLQTYNSIRVLDWFSELPEVDPARIGVTGASGGGTQTFMLCAIDPRPAAAFPAVMVSTAMQGGCTCENATYLRVDTGNIELAALIAPRPLGMTAAKDWTEEIMAKGLPELQKHYAMLGAKDNVMAKALVHFPHNYNYVSRAVMYSWFNRHLKLGFEDPIVEEDFQPLTESELTVWDDKHPKPPSGPDYERSLVRWMTDDAKQQIAAAAPNDAASLAKYRELIGGALEVMIGHKLADFTDAKFSATKSEERDGYRLQVGVLRSNAHGQEVPTIILEPKTPAGTTVVWLDTDGKAGLFGEGDKPNPGVAKLLDKGATVIGLDLLYQGEYLADGKPLQQTPKVKNPREFAGYTFGYNHPLFAQRVHDTLLAIAYARSREPASSKVHLIGLDGAGKWVAAARALAGDTVGRAAVDTAGFRFEKLTAIHDPDFLPGAVKYGDVPAILALSAPGELWIGGEADQSSLVQAAYRSAGSESAATYSSAADKDRMTEAVNWLLP